MGLQKIERNSVSDAVYDQLSREILEGRMSAGQTLPAERALCQMLGVNRGAVREALKRLSQAGLVQVRHGGGATVLDFRETAGMDLLSGLLFSSDGATFMSIPLPGYASTDWLGRRVSIRRASTVAGWSRSGPTEH